METAKELRSLLLAQERDFGPNHVKVANTLVAIADLLTHHGQLSEAEPIYWRVVEIRHKLSGQSNLDVAATLEDLSSLYETQGNSKEAERLLRWSCDIRKKLCGPSSDEYKAGLERLRRLAGDVSIDSDADGELQPPSSVPQPREDFPWEEHFNRGVELQEREQLVAAEELFNCLLAVAKHFAPLSINHARALDHMARTYLFQGRFKESRKHFEQALAIFENTAGFADLDTVECLEGTADAHASLEEPEQARFLYAWALSVAQKEGFKEPADRIIGKLAALPFVSKVRGLDDALVEKVLAAAVPPPVKKKTGAMIMKPGSNSQVPAGGLNALLEGLGTAPTKKSSTLLKPVLPAANTQTVITQPAASTAHSATRVETVSQPNAAPNSVRSTADSGRPKTSSSMVKPGAAGAVPAPPTTPAQAQSPPPSSGSPLPTSTPVAQASSIVASPTRAVQSPLEHAAPTKSPATRPALPAGGLEALLKDIGPRRKKTTAAILRPIAMVRPDAAQPLVEPITPTQIAQPQPTATPTPPNYTAGPEGSLSPRPQTPLHNSQVAASAAPETSPPPTPEGAPAPRNEPQRLPTATPLVAAEQPPLVPPMQPGNTVPPGSDRRAPEPRSSTLLDESSSGVESVLTESGSMKKHTLGVSKPGQRKTGSITKIAVEPAQYSGPVVISPSGQTAGPPGEISPRSTRLPAPGTADHEAQPEGLKNSLLRKSNADGARKPFRPWQTPGDRPPLEELLLSGGTGSGASTPPSSSTSSGTSGGSSRTPGSTSSFGAQQSPTRPQPPSRPGMNLRPKPDPRASTPEPDPSVSMPEDNDDPVVNNILWEKYIGQAERQVQMRNAREAERLLILALEKAQCFGEADPRLWQTQCQLAKVYEADKKYVRAGHLYRELLQQAEKHLGPAHPDVVTYLERLGELYTVQDRWDEAESCYQHMLRILKKSGNQMVVSDIMGRLGLVQRRRQQR